MAISWGAYEGPTNERVGIEITANPSSVGASTDYVDLTIKYYVYSQYSIGDNQTLTLSGAATGSYSFFCDEGSNILVATKTLRVYTSFSESIKKTFSAAISGHYAGATPSHSLSYTVAKRPYATPSAPTSAAVARVSDTQHTVSWVRPSNASTEQYTWSGVKIERWDNVTGSYVQVATVTGTGTSWSDTGTVANRQYQYRVRSYNSAGHSGYVYSSSIRTTPAAPTNVVATRNGMDIDLTWVNPAGAETAVEVWDSPAGGALVLVATLAADATSYKHITPDATKTHQYSVRTKADSLYSTYGVSGVVQLQTAPAAPTNLSPVGGVFAASEGILLTWQHNPIDSSPQSAYEVAWREAGGVWNYTGKVLSTASQRLMTGLVNGKTYEWKVDTWGAHANASPWSATASFTTSARPSVLLTSPPYDDYVHNSPFLTVQHTYTDPEAKAQTAHKTVLKDSSGNVLWQKQTAGAGLSEAVPVSLQDGQTYVIEKSVQDTDGMWSAVTSRSFTVDYPEPALPVLLVDYNEDSGEAVVTVKNPLPENLVNEIAGFDGAGALATGWTLSDGYTAEGWMDPEGNRWQRFFGTNSSAEASYPELRPTVPLTEGFVVGDKVRVSFDVFGIITGTGATLRMGVTQRDGAGTLITWGDMDMPVPPSSYATRTRMSAELVIQSGTTQIIPRVSVLVPANGGTCDLYIDNASLEVVTLPEVVYNDIYRQVDDGALELLAAGVPPQSAVVDRLPGLNNLNRYVARAYSALPSMAESETILQTQSEQGWIYFNSGNGYEDSARFRLSPKLQDSFGRQAQAHQFAGRKRPVLFTGEALTDKVSASGILESDADVEALKRVLEFEGPVCYRDPRGRRIFAKVESPQTGRSGHNAPDFSVTLERVESPFGEA